MINYSTHLNALRFYTEQLSKDIYTEFVFKEINGKIILSSVKSFESPEHGGRKEREYSGLSAEELLEASKIACDYMAHLSNLDAFSKKSTTQIPLLTREQVLETLNSKRTTKSGSRPQEEVKLLDREEIIAKIAKPLTEEEVEENNFHKMMDKLDKQFDVLWLTSEEGVMDFDIYIPLIDDSERILFDKVSKKFYLNNAQCELSIEKVRNRIKDHKKWEVLKGLTSNSLKY